MKSWLARLALSLCLGTLPGWAQPPLESALGFYEKAQVRVDLGDLRGILEQARADPGCSRYLLGLLEQRLPGLDPAHQQSTRKLMTLLARGLALAGQPQALRDLEARSLLTVEESTLTLESAPSLPLSPALEEAIDWKTWGFANLQRLADLGNFRQCARLAQAYRSFLRESGSPESEVLSLAIQECLFLAGDFPHSAARRQQMLEWAGADRDEQRRLHTLLAATALDNGRADLAREVLVPLERSLAGASPEQRGLSEFILETTRMQLEIRQTGRSEWPVMLQHHRAAWTALAQYHGRFHSETRLWQRGVAFWMDLLQHSLNVDEHAQEAMELVRADNELALRLSHEALEQHSYAAQIGDFNRLLSIELERQRLAVQPPEHAQKLLGYTRESLDHYRQWMTEDQQTQNEICPPCLRRRLGSGFQLDLLHGDLSLLESRYLTLLQVTRPSRSGVERLLSESQLALRNQGHSGFADARYLLLRQPGMEVNGLLPVLKSLQEDWQRLQFRPGLIGLAFVRGDLLQRQGKADESVEALERATGLLEQYLADFSGSPALVNVYRADYELLARLYSDQGRGLEAFAVINRLKNLEAVQRGSAALLQRPELAELRQLSHNSQALQEQSIRQRSLDLDSTPATQLLASGRRQFSQVLRELLRRSPQYRQALTVTPGDLASAQRCLPADAALIQYVPGREGLYVFLVTRKAFKMRRVPVPEGELSKRVARLRGSLSAFRLRPELVKGFSWTDKAWPGYQNYTLPLRADSEKLYDWLIRPLEGDLRPYKVLAFVPSGNLYYLPMAGLIRGLGPKGPDFVAHHWQCVELLKAADLRALTARVGPRVGGLLALANPDGSLPGAEREVQRIAGFFPLARLHLGQDASAGWLKPLPRGIVYLHLATHGILNPGLPAESYLVAANGPLRIRDVYGLDLKQVRLVTLSACQTAVQEGEQAGSEVTSLAQAFSVAGGRAVLASLWDVSDEGTERLMTALYPRISSGQSLSAALQQAQLEVMAQPGFQHPYYWAAFSLFGDWR